MVCQGEPVVSGNIYKYLRTMDQNTIFGSYYGRLEWVAPAVYMRGNFRYVCTEDGDCTGEHWDIVEDLETGDLYFTVI